MTDRIPLTEAELLSWLTDGLLEEDHQTDLKEELGVTARANRELAKDLAAMAIDGGVIYVGIREDKDANTFELRPVKLEGLRERIDQVARMRPQPPIPVKTTEIPTARDPSSGYVVIEVGPTHDAPHMVDGRYMGRSDTTNYALSDAEVVRLHERRVHGAQSGDGMLREEIARDPWAEQPNRDQAEAHLFVAAQPALADPELLVRSVPERNLRQWLNRLVVGGELRRVDPAGFAGYSPDVSMATSFSSRARGAAAHTYCVSPERLVRPNGDIAAAEDDLLDLEVWEDGGVRLFCGRASHTSRDGSVLLGGVILGLTDRTLQTAVLASRQAGYRGAWTVGVALTGLRGRPLHEAQRVFPPTSSAGFSADEYLSTTSTSLDELESDRRAVVLRLLGRLLRALGAGEELAQTYTPRS